MPRSMFRSAAPLSRRALSRAGTVALLLLIAGPAAAQFGPVPVTVMEVVERKVAAGQTFVGTVMPVRQSIVGSAIDGRVINFYVNEGDFVKKDQPLAQLRTEALEIQIAAAKAELQLRDQELKELQNGSRPEELAQAKARMQAAEAAMSYRQSRYKRMRGLVEQRAASPDEIQETASAAEAASQLLIESKATYKLAVLGPRKERVAQGKARVASAEQEVKRLQDLLSKHTMVAPFDGYVVAEHTEVGQWIAQADPVVEIVELSEVDVHVWVLESYIPEVQLGMPAAVQIGAFGKRAFIGEVRRIVPKADLKSRSFPVKVKLVNTSTPGGPLLKPGMMAHVTFAIGQPQQATLVPKDALVLGGATPVVYVLQGREAKGGKVTAVPVELGIVDRDWIQVKGSISAGQRVVVQGNERLQNGAEVVLVQPPKEPARKAEQSSRPRRGISVR